jgi:hypothetical protein
VGDWQDGSQRGTPMAGELKGKRSLKTDLANAGAK